MSARKEMKAGLKYGRLTSMQFSRKGVDRSPSQEYWLFQCECGKVTEARVCKVRSGSTTSCGCYRRERIVETQTNHGGAKFPEYKVWAQMKQRCNNPNDAKYYLYGGRGITIDPEWEDFTTFISDMGRRPSEDHQIERIDNEGNYTKTNCKWATRLEQANNRRHWGTSNNKNLAEKD